MEKFYMVDKYRKWPRRVFHVAIGSIFAAYVLSSLVPFVSSSSLGLLSILGLFFPWIFFSFLVIAIILIFYNWKWAIICWCFMFLGWQAISTTFGSNLSDSETLQKKSQNDLRVLFWNVYRWDEQNRDLRGGWSNRDKMIQSLAEYDADILCFHEFYEPSRHMLGKFPPNIQAVQNLGYPYYYFYPSSIIADSSMQFGMILFSRLPIIDKHKSEFDDAQHSEGLMSIDVKWQTDTVRILSTHLESFRLGITDYFGTNQGISSKLKSSIKSVNDAYRSRLVQTDIVGDQMRQSPYPMIMCGNLGDVPVSNTYYEISSGLKDAFLEKGYGMGRTFRFLAPNLRLDYILVDKAFDVISFYRKSTTYSDHLPIITDVAIR